MEKERDRTQDDRRDRAVYQRLYVSQKMTGDIIGKISEQLGSYRDIQEKIKDIRRRIGLLTEVQEAGSRKAAASAELFRTRGP